MNGSFHRFGEEITKLLIAYPMINKVWMVNGEEFITSLSECGGDTHLTDPWLRNFPEEMLNESKTVELPEKHVKVQTTVAGIGVICNVYARKLNKVEVDCKICEGNDVCLECNKTLRKIVCFPQMN
jgi:hypothetical protein